MSTSIHVRTLIVGMEIHVELKTQSKMFCGCKNDPFHAPQPNIYTCPVCLGMPGGLPVANKKAVEWTMRLGLALGCTIAELSKFDRKHYFYPDLSKGYQISQYDQPLCENGVVHTEFGDVRIRRVHLEEDTGKLQHTTLDGKKVSLIDFNRCGVPLVEIVTEPDIHSPEQAKAYAKKIQQIVRTLDISDADMEKGSMRLEANISLTDDPKILPNYKVEAKNINSFRFLEQAIVFECERQSSLLDAGTTPTQETRGWSEAKHATVSQRTKEDAEDYRYFPDPDLPPMKFEKSYIESLKKNLPELPDAQQARYESMGIKPSFASLLSSTEYDAKVVDEALSLGKAAGLEATAIASVMINKKIDTSKVSAKDIIKLATETYAKESVDEGELLTIVKQILEEQPKAVADYKAGKQQVIGFLLGMVMKKLGKKVDTKIVQSILVKTIESL